MIDVLYKLAMSFGKIGLIAMGGGNAMLKLIETEVVQHRHWISPEEFARFLGSTFLFPGLTGVKLSALIGYKTAGVLGLLVAVMAINIPGLVLTLIGYHLFMQSSSITAQKLMIAVQYGALALLAAATISFGQGIAQTYISWPICLMSVVFLIGLATNIFSPFWGFLVFIMICFPWINL